MSRCVQSSAMTNRRFGRSALRSGTVASSVRRIVRISSDCWNLKTGDMTGSRRSPCRFTDSTPNRNAEESHHHAGTGGSQIDGPSLGSAAECTSGKIVLTASLRNLLLQSTAFRPLFVTLFRWEPCGFSSGGLCCGTPHGSDSPLSINQCV